MEKLNDIVWVVLGLVYGLMAYDSSLTGAWGMWIIALGFLLVGVKGFMDK